MKKEVGFYKDDDKWYADVPNHTKDENEMVMGSDLALDYLAQGGNKIILTMSDEYTPNYMLHLNMVEHDDDGAYYQVCGNNDLLEPIWICNVTHDVFGEHPKDIYLTKIEKNESKIQQRL